MRSISSAKCFMAGLYDELLEKSKDDPIIIHTTESRNEFLYPNIRSCPLLKRFYKIVFGTSDKIQLANKEIFQDILQVDDMKYLLENKLLAKNAVDVLDDLTSRRSHGMTLPDALNSHYHRIKEVAYNIACDLFKEKKSLKAASGRFIHEILNKMDAAINNRSLTKLCLYSAHDTSLMALSSAVTGKPPTVWPPFASFMVFEVYRTLDLIVNDCGGSVECPYNRFKEILSNLALDDKQFEKFCEIQDEN